MNTKKKYALGIASIVLAGTVALGSVASASGNGNGDANGRQRGDRPHLTTEQKCDRQEQIAGRVAKVQQRMADRLTTLEGKRAAAETANDTELVAQLDQRISRLEKVQQRVETKYGKYQTWAAENC
jgi:hypothetical protein